MTVVVSVGRRRTIEERGEKRDFLVQQVRVANRMLAIRLVQWLDRLKGILQQRKKERKPRPRPQTPQAGKGDSVGRFRRYQWSILINNDKNLSMCGTFLPKLIYLPDNRELLRLLIRTPKKIHDLNLNAVTLSIWSVWTPTSISVPKNCTILVCLHSFLLSPHPLPGMVRDSFLDPMRLFDSTPPGPFSPAITSWIWVSATQIRKKGRIQSLLV